MPICSACREDFGGPFCPSCGATPSISVRRIAFGPAAASATQPVSVRAEATPSAAGFAGAAGAPRWSGTNVIEGTVVRIDPAIRTPGRRDGWKAATCLLLALGLLPLAAVLWFFSLAVRIGLRFLGLGGRRGGSGLLSEIFAFHLVGAAMRPGEPIATYFYVVSTDQGQVAVRQDDELADGRMFVGNRVRLAGSWRGGTFLLRDGMNQTLGSSLAARRSPWRLALPAALIVVAVEYLALLSALGGQQ